uniref:Uncharacterized protein n=1 Tax=Panagrolaimus sp. ES5 TaxID=591445 RepID=A0AC34GUJ1_9BILA
MKLILNFLELGLPATKRSKIGVTAEPPIESDVIVDEPVTAEYVTRSGRRRRLISAPSAIVPVPNNVVRKANNNSNINPKSTGAPIKVIESPKTVVNNLKRPTAIVVRRSPANSASKTPSPDGSTQQKTYIITTADGTKFRRNASGITLSSTIVPVTNSTKTYKICNPTNVPPIVGSLDSGISLGGYIYESSETTSSRSSASNSKKSTPNGSKRSSPTTTKFPIVTQTYVLQTQRNGESPTERQVFLSESPNSYNTRE